MRTDPEIRFWAKVEKTEGCWLWRAKADRNGYGEFNPGDRMVMAHRYAYERLVGPIPAGLTIDHTCNVRNCVNPAHLEAVTQKVNLHRSPNTWASRHAQKTHCPQGHPYVSANLVNTKRGDRVCRICNQAKALARYRARQRAKSA